MKVLAKSVHIIDYQADRVEKKPIPKDITDFIQNLLTYITCIPGNT